MEGDGKKMDQAPPFRNPFVHVLKFTPMEKAKVISPRSLTGEMFTPVQIRWLAVK